MSTYRISWFVCFTCLAASAQTLTTLRVSSEVAPVGGMAQVKLLVTSPKPILSGFTTFDMSAVSFDSIDGINLFSPTSDVAGAAVVNGSQVTLRFSSPGGTFGLSTDYPLMTVATRLRNTVYPGEVMPVNMNGLASSWLNAGGSFQFEYKPGSITVGGSISVTNVIPGGGVLPPGASFSIIGMGFTPKTSIAIRGIAVSSIQYISPTEFRATTRKEGRLDGVLIQAKNPDGSQDIYYSYMRGIPMGTSARPLLAATVPIFPMNGAFEAIVPSTISPLVNSDYFTAIALQNCSLSPANVVIQAISPQGAVTGTVNVTMQPGHRFQREYAELFGAPLPAGASVRVVSDQAVQMLGLLGNDRTGVVMPVWPSVLRAPALVPAGK